MPFDATPPETEVFSLQGLIDWLEMQPGETEYVYVNSWGCLLCHYFRARGIDVNYLTMCGYVTNGSTEYQSYPMILRDVSISHPQTYAAALTRARNLLAKQEQTDAI